MLNIIYQLLFNIINIKIILLSVKLKLKFETWFQSLGLHGLFWLLPWAVSLLIIEVSLSILSYNLSCMSNVTTFLLLYPYLTFRNGVEDDWLASCLSIFYFESILLSSFFC